MPCLQPSQVVKFCISDTKEVHTDVYTPCCGWRYKACPKTGQEQIEKGNLAVFLTGSSLQITGQQTWQLAAVTEPHQDPVQLVWKAQTDGIMFAQRVNINVFYCSGCPDHVKHHTTAGASVFQWTCTIKNKRELLGILQ